jgi:hypothetical protein
MMRPKFVALIADPGERALPGAMTALTEDGRAFWSTDEDPWREIAGTDPIEGE